MIIFLGTTMTANIEYKCFQCHVETTMPQKMVCKIYRHITAQTAIYCL